ncbi:MAG: M28 family peptidase [Desulfobacterales bacterium]|nr:M28 family peptidase [Desulfobacterales bacterium]
MSIFFISNFKRKKYMVFHHSHRTANTLLGFILFFFSTLLLNFPIIAKAQNTPEHHLMDVIEALTAMGDRSSGTAGCEAAAVYIKKKFSQLGIDQIGSHRFSIPVIRNSESCLYLPERDLTLPLCPMMLNAISPETIAPEGLEGPLLYVSSGELYQFNGKIIKGAIILMDIESGKNWLNAVNLGAKALIYVDRGLTPKTYFEEKFELSPIQFPRFWLPYAHLKKIFDNFENAPQGLVTSRIRLNSKMSWQIAPCENIYGLIPGNDPRLQEELVLVEAFYDSTAMVLGHSPGADEACSAATLLEVARYLKKNPPARSVLLVATSGHAQTLSGMRELIWSLSTNAKELRKMQTLFKERAQKCRNYIKALENASFSDPEENASNILLQEAVDDRIKTELDKISRQLMFLRLQQENASDPAIIDQLAHRRLLLTRFGWRATRDPFTQEELRILSEIIPQAINDQKTILSDVENQLKTLKSARNFRALVKSMELTAVVSLHLSSHGDGIGAFNQGWLYPLKTEINRVEAYSMLAEVLRNSAQNTHQADGSHFLFCDTLRPSRLHPWQSYFIDRPALGGEVSALAGYLGISLVTVNDARPMWGTPYDLPEKVDREQTSKQTIIVCNLINSLAQVSKLHTGNLPGNGFATITGRAKFLRHGELFADQAAPGTMILAYQGTGRYHAMVDSLGLFRIKGVADKKHVLDKVIIEGYRFDPSNGSVIWAIDKKQTGKPAYRLKMQRRTMETDLVMFACKQTTLFNLLEPRSFRYMTKIELLDARREAEPLRFWYSRIDTRASIISSIYLEPGTPLKMTLSDTVLHKKMILTNAEEERPEGIGYRVDDYPTIDYTEFKVARDMWMLLAPRITNLEDHGIFNTKIRNLQQEGVEALKQAKHALEEKLYDQFTEAARRSWALASRVYDDVQKTQKDVLFGVLFYIALFVPFAFCLERLLFSYTDIHKRIIAFCAILILLIALIYKIHPAFQLAYSPMVVILAFFIIGLSLMVTLIIFFRFEEEMILLQRRAKHMQAAEISRWKAFVAAFFLGVSNLRRRRLRTILTCLTLIILTFTIMSFTTVKTMRHHGRLLVENRASYQGFLLKNFNWQDLPPEALGILFNAFEGKAILSPRVWLQNEDRTCATSVPVRFKNIVNEAQGLVGLSAHEVDVTQLNKILVGGRWFQEEELFSVLLPDRMAVYLGIDPKQPQGHVVLLWGVPFVVVGTFSGKMLQEQVDLDGEPITPVTFPSEVSMEITEVEMEALESGEEIQIYQSRYQHTAGDLTLIIPYKTLLAAGGRLKAVAIRPNSESQVQTMAQNLVDRFGLTLFSGEPNGIFMYNASDTLIYSGVPNIVIPLFISIFIVLNTMIGSVYERKREIGIYTSVGLAPSHVSFLFIAEAMAFAVLSVVLGYLLAQTTARIFAGTVLWKGITVNYSSLSGVAAMVLVIVVVLVSVIYPSRVAAQIAIPDVKRSWSLPSPRGNILEITLPFLMNYREHRSVGGFLLAYFQEHQNVSHGIFSTGDVGFSFQCLIFPNNTQMQSVESEEACCIEECVLINSKVWLAPFDFGIMQDVAISFCPAAEESGYMEINVRIERKSGEINAWKRINKSFLYELRKQLLIWRSLDELSHAHYHQMIDFKQANNKVNSEP